MKWTAYSLLALATAWGQGEFATGQAARLMIGQRVFTEGAYGASDVLLGSLSGVSYAANTLVVVDATVLGSQPNNNRVLIYRNVNGFVPDVRAEFVQNPEVRCRVCVGKADVVLGQEDFSKTEQVRTPSAKTVRNPTGVAYNGRILAVADTNSNRVLIWRSLPTANNQAADIVIGQPDFTTVSPGRTRSKMAGPQGVWLDASDGLWVADTFNNRVLYFARPERNGQDAALVLGQPDFTTNVQPAQLSIDYIIEANTMLSPTGVSSDGQRLYVADLGFNRVLIWNSVPTANNARADVVVGQKELSGKEHGSANNTPALCEPSGKDADGKDFYPGRCNKTLNFPRSVISDGRRLYVADAGNDRILIYRTIPNQNAAAADIVIGHQGDTLDQTSDSAFPERVSSSDSFRTPHSLAWDGNNLYATDVFNRRVMIFTPGDFALPFSAVRNAASPLVYAVGGVTLSGEVTKDDELTITIKTTDADKKDYVYKVKEGDSFESIIDAFVLLINADGGDKLVLATPLKRLNGIIFTARAAGPEGNLVQTPVKTSENAKTLITAIGGTLSGGQDAARIAPYSLVAILGERLSDQTIAADVTKPLPLELGGVRVYFDGVLSPLASVAPDRVVAQMPLEVRDATSVNAILRTRRANGVIEVSAASPVPIIGQNPGVFGLEGVDPRPGVVLHYSSHATATVSVDGLTAKDDKASVFIRGREYTYTAVEKDTNTIVRDKLIALINESDPEVEAFASGVFDRIRLRARVAGPVGNGIPISASNIVGAGVLMTALSSELCCANQAGAPVTEDNPAIPGETIVVLATGLGVVSPEEALFAMQNGNPYNGPEVNNAIESVSSLAGGRTANVLFAGLRRGAVGVYEVHLELNTDIPTNPATQVTIAQSFQVSNIFTVPVVNPRGTTQ